MVRHERTLLHDGRIADIADAAAAEKMAAEKWLAVFSFVHIPICGGSAILRSIGICNLH